MINLHSSDPIRNEFVGRYRELLVFEEIVRQKKHSLLVSVSGIGGIGKSWFISNLNDISSQKHEISKAYIDLRRLSSDYAYLVEEIGNQLDTSVFNEVNTCIVNYSNAWKKIFADKLDGKLPTNISIHLDHNIFQGSVGDIVGVKIEDVQFSIPAIEIERIEREIVKSVTSTFISGLQTLLQTKTVIIFFDGFEIIEDPEVNRYTQIARDIRELLCSCLKIEQTNRLIVVIGRRRPIDWDLTNREWHYFIRHIHLDPFSWEDYLNYLERRCLVKHLDNDVIKSIWRFTTGHPQCVALASDLIEELFHRNFAVSASIFEKYKGEFDAKLVTEFLISQILEKIPEDLAEIIERMSVPHYFDASIMAKLCPGLGNLSILLDRIKQFSFVRRATKSKGYVYHDIVRDLLVAKLFQDNEQGLRELHYVSCNYYLAIYEDFQQEREPFEQQNLLVEIIYHHLNYDVTGGLKRFHSTYNFGERSYQLPLCDQLVSILEESAHLANLGEWLKYYKARLAYIHNNWHSAELEFKEIINQVKDNDLLLAYTHEALGSLKQAQGSLENALIEFESSLNLQEKLKDIRHSIRTLNEMGTAYRTSIQWAPAIDCYQKALKLADSIIPEELLEEKAYSYLYLGVIYTGLGKYEDALSCYDKSWGIYARIGDKYGEARVQQRYGWLARIRGQFDIALDYHVKALVTFRKLGFLHSLAECLHSKGTVHRVRKEYDLAIQHYYEALKLFEDLNAGRHIGLVLNDLGLLYQALQRPAQALDCFQQSLEKKLASGQEREASTTLNNIGDIFINLNQWEDAEQNLQKSLEIARQINCPINVVRALTSLCELNYQRETYDQLSNYAEEATWLGEKDGYNHYISRVYKIYALAYFKRGFLDDSAKALAKSLFFAMKYNQSFMVDILNLFNSELEDRQKGSYNLFMNLLLPKIVSLELDADSIETIKTAAIKALRIYDGKPN